jgi:hypothetical protein
MSSSSSRDRVAEDTYESQNDQRLDDLHAKIRTIRGVTTDIHNDVEAQNLLLDDSVRYCLAHGAGTTRQAISIRATRFPRSPPHYQTQREGPVKLSA